MYNPNWLEGGDIMFDLSKYTQLKATGNISVNKVNGQVFMVKKHFDSDTGQAINRTIPLAIAELQNRITAEQAVLANLQALVTDIQALG